MSMVSVIIVTHNSEGVIGQCLASLQEQTVRPDSVILVDSGSTDRQYLEQYRQKGVLTQIVYEKNIGFARANNVGFRHVDPSSDFILFLNPDAFPAPDSVEKACIFLADNPRAGCVSGRLLGYDAEKMEESGRLDSTGVFRKWYGRWYDRGQGEPNENQYCSQEDLPAACGAFLFCRKTMLNQTAPAKGAVFDSDFFMYKEDIELCLRIRKAHWRIVYLPDMIVYHCRGWQGRQQISHRLRLTAAESEILLYRKHPSPYMVWAMVKYGLVRWLRL